MKRLFLLTTTIFLFAAQMYAQNGKLIVRFENLKNNDGKVMVALFDGKESFSKHESTQTELYLLKTTLPFGYGIAS